MGAVPMAEVKGFTAWCSKQQCLTRPAGWGYPPRGFCLGQRHLPGPCRCARCCVLAHSSFQRLSRGWDILTSAGSSWARMLHSVNNFWRSCCIFLLQILGGFWIRECSWLGGSTGLQMRAWYPCPVSHHRSLPAWDCHPKRTSSAQSQSWH